MSLPLFNRTWCALRKSVESAQNDWGLIAMVLVLQTGCGRRIGLVSFLLTREGMPVLVHRRYLAAKAVGSGGAIQYQLNMNTTPPHYSDFEMKAIEEALKAMNDESEHDARTADSIGS